MEPTQGAHEVSEIKSQTTPTLVSYLVVSRSLSSRLMLSLSGGQFIVTACIHAPTAPGFSDHMSLSSLITECFLLYFLK